SRQAQRIRMERAAERERERVAREIHDVLAHTLSALAVQLEATRVLAERRPGDPGVAEAIGRSHRLAREGLDEARRAVGALRGEAAPGPDELLVREGLFTLLGLLPGIEVTGAAGDGDEALRLVAEHAPDIALMDLRMPGMDGVEATRRIRSEHPGTQVVTLTTYADDESIL